MKKVLVSLGIVMLVVALLFVFRGSIEKKFFSPTTSNIETGITSDMVKNNAPQKDIEIVAENLDIPWEIEFLPNGNMLVTERSGKLLLIGKETKTISEIQGVRHVGEGGLLGMVLHPNFSSNNYIYLYLTTQSGGGLVNRVERYKLFGDELSGREVTLDNIPGAQFHDGGRMGFGPDGYLYITTGDAGDGDLAQETNTLNGKILRIKDDGGIPEDNPFGNFVYTYGHRNPQGLAWDNKGQLWATEHGPSGLGSGFDEVNLIEKGKNYGWPDIQGDETKAGMITPVIQSGSSDTWAPAGTAYMNGSLFFGGLRGEALYEAKINSNNTLSLKAHFKGEYGRIRAVTLGPDGFLYISTSNRDGRGTINTSDDKIIRINPSIF